MGDLVPFTPRVSAKLYARPQKLVGTAKKKRGKRIHLGFNLYIPPVRVQRLQSVQRNVLHGILSAFDWSMTTGLFRQIFIDGGVFRVRCNQEDIDEILEQIDLRLPELEVRLVRAA